MQATINRLRAKKQDEGFTLIELLVVVVIIGVLVAIAVPVYLNYRQGAADKAAQSDLRGAVSAIEQFYTNNGNAYPAAIAADTAGTAGKVDLKQGTTTMAQINVSDGTVVGLANNTSTYVICSRNTNGTSVGSITKMYVYNSNGGSVKTSTQTTMALCLSTGS